LDLTGVGGTDFCGMDDEYDLTASAVLYNLLVKYVI